MEYYDTINYRGWVKSFHMEDVSGNLEEKINHYVKYLRGFRETLGDKFEIVRYDSISRGHMGLFTTKAPYYFLVYITDLEEQLLNAGYMMGELSLYLMTKEIGSCLVGLEQVKKRVSGEVVYATSALEQMTEFPDKTWVAIMGFGMPEHKIKESRKKLFEKISDKRCIYRSDVDARVKSIINVGVHAPSKLLIRPYRYVINKNQVLIYAKGESMMAAAQRVCVFLDCGIMLAYFGLKAEEQWMTMLVKRSEKRVGKEWKGFKYLVSLSFQDQ